MDNTKYAATIYAIKDNVADQIIGGLYLHKHEAAAVRFFADVASTKGSLVGAHPQDFDLLRLGYITHFSELQPDHTVILRGSNWIAANESPTQVDLDPNNRSK